MITFGKDILMKATVTTEFPGLTDGATQVRTIKKGETITGDLARAAVAAKFADEVKEAALGQYPALPAKLNKDLSIDALKAYAIEHKIELGTAATAAEIIAVIEKAELVAALNKMTIPQLKALAAEKVIALGDAKDKSDIVAALELAIEAKA